VKQNSEAVGDKTTKTRKIVIGAAAAAAVLVIVVALTSGSSQADSVLPAVNPVAVEVTPVEVANLEETVSAVGTIEAMRDVEVSSETAGRVLKVLVKVGDRVRAGQPLILVDSELKAAAVEQARAQEQAARTTFEKAAKDYERAKTLYASGDVADVELEAYRLGLHGAEAQLKGAEAAFAVAKRQLQDTRVTSPVDGRVASRFVEVGEMVAPGTKIANIVDVSRLKVKLGIPEEEIVRIRDGQKATMRVDANPETAFPGTVYTVGAKAENPTGHTYPVEVVIENRSPDLLKVGMFARVAIRTSKADSVLAVSKESLVSEGEGFGLFVVEDGVARHRKVTLGIQAGDLYEVVTGLKARDRVVSFGQKGLKDGVPVREQ
jgi:RND family efflux transporter MFP subunit